MPAADCVPPLGTALKSYTPPQAVLKKRDSAAGKHGLIIVRVSGCDAATDVACRRCQAMKNADVEILQCKFCSGHLRLDLERKERAPGFHYYRCEDCKVPNVFAAHRLSINPLRTTVVKV